MIPNCTRLKGLQRLVAPASVTIAWSFMVGMSVAIPGLSMPFILFKINRPAVATAPELLR